jgi:hypothetical protein
MRRPFKKHGKAYQENSLGTRFLFPRKVLLVTYLAGLFEKCALRCDHLHQFVPGFHE